MTTPLNQTQIVSAVQEKNKMLFDHEPASASMQRSSPCSAMPDDRSQASTQPSSAGQHAFASVYLHCSLCSRCGSVRQAIADLPAHSVIGCPECGQECTFVLLGSGLTSRNLPFHQVHIVEPTRWDPQLDGETNSS